LFGYKPVKTLRYSTIAAERALIPETISYRWSIAGVSMSLGHMIAANAGMLARPKPKAAAGGLVA
jgi:hypothetical protein